MQLRTRMIALLVPVLVSLVYFVMHEVASVRTDNTQVADSSSRMSRETANLARTLEALLRDFKLPMKAIGLMETRRVA